MPAPASRDAAVSPACDSLNAYVAEMEAPEAGGGPAGPVRFSNAGRAERNAARGPECPRRPAADRRPHKLQRDSGTVAPGDGSCEWPNGKALQLPPISAGWPRPPLRDTKCRRDFRVLLRG